MVVQRLAEVRPQAVRLAIDVRLDECPTIGPVQVNEDVALSPDQLLENSPDT
jgi:hypothetical protein